MSLLNVGRRAQAQWRGERLEVGMTILVQMAQILFGDSVPGASVGIRRGAVYSSRQVP